MIRSPTVREAGQGEPVICLHSSASSGGQWRALIEHLSPLWRVLAPDLLGYGRQAPKQSLPDFCLAHELDWLEPVFQQAGKTFHLVGHSYGGLIALLTALKYPSRVMTIVVYEPTAWSVAVHADPAHPGALEIEALRQNAFRSVAADRLMDAAEHFVRYWAGDKAWEAMPSDRREITAQGMRKVRDEFAGEIQAHASGQASIDAYSGITLPMRYLTGSSTKAPVQRVAELLVPAIASAEHIDLEGLGHMGPVTHPQVVNHQISEFLSSQS